MDIEKLIHCLQCCSRVDAHNIGCDDCGLEYCGPECQQLCGTAATALSTLQAENEKLRAELERMKKIMRDNGIMTIPPKYPGGPTEWNIPKPRSQKED